MEQTSFLPPPPFAPVWPQPQTLAAQALEIFLRGEGLTHPQFEAVSFSWRLSAVVAVLRDLGWPIEADDIAAPTFESPHRAIARYHLPQKFILLASELRAGGER
jgi:hypothetical protein